MDENETKITGIDVTSIIQTEGSSRSTYKVYIIFIQLLLSLLSHKQYCNSRIQALGSVGLVPVAGGTLGLSPGVAGGTATAGTLPHLWASCGN